MKFADKVLGGRRPSPVACRLDTAPVAKVEHPGDQQLGNGTGPATSTPPSAISTGVFRTPRPRGADRLNQACGLDADPHVGLLHG